ncbi:MAG: UTP--glucose-1-phosphate uridylyltransferase [Synergistes sp.]|nr:UTP--glucose-1-phosphate uridylyltransferase [Synergistes sp.]
MPDASFKPVRKAVFPVAGLGTRFLPATKDVPKEMMTLIDRPLIHHGVDEAVKSGCSEIMFVTGQGKESIRRYFEPSAELVSVLRERGKNELAEKIDRIHRLARFEYSYQEKPLGLGHAVLCAEKFCKDEYFGLILPDDVMIAEPTVLCQLEAVRKRYNSSVLCVEKVAECDVRRYGIIDAEETEDGIFRVKGLVEKPEPEKAPSNLAIMGRYLLSPSIFECLRKITPGAGGEYQLTDALSLLLKKEPVYAVLYKGTRLDCGVKEGWIKATVIKALHDPQLRDIVIEAVKESGIHI